MAKTSKGGLGKGFGALLGESLMADTEAGQGISTLPMALVEPNPDQPRKVFDREAMEALKQSIATHGVITPITVRMGTDGYYQIIAGERRWRAARSVGLTEIPAMVIEATDSQVMELALIENLQREDLNPIEEAEGYDVLIHRFGMTQEQVADRVGKSRPAVSNALRLLALPVKRGIWWLPAGCRRPCAGNPGHSGRGKTAGSHWTDCGHVGAAGGKICPADQSCRGRGSRTVFPGAIYGGLSCGGSPHSGKPSGAQGANRTGEKKRYGHVRVLWCG